MNISNSHKLKELNTRLQNAIKHINEAGDNLSPNEYYKQQTIISNLRKEIKALKNEDTIVSEHAILRYFQYVLGFDLEDIIKKLLTDELGYNISVVGNGEFPIENNEGVKAVVKNNVIVTLIKNKR